MNPAEEINLIRRAEERVLKFVGGSAPAKEIPDDNNNSMRPASELVKDYAKYLQERFSGGEKKYLSSGIKTLDSCFPGWFHQGHLIVMAGRPAMGKSALAQQIGEFVSSQNRTVILFTLEMSAHEITERAISRRSGITIPTIKTADKLDEDDWRKITKSIVEFGKLPVYVDDGTNDIESITEKTKAMAKEIEQMGLPPLGCVLIDYIQLVTTAKGAANRTIEIGIVTAALKRLAREMDVPVIAISQLNRGVESRTNKRPTLSDLRESGNIEQDADLILFIYRDDYYNPDSQDKGMAEIIVGKNRHGSSGSVKLVFVGDKLMFGDLAHV